MKIWKRNAVVVTVFLFVCAGIYLNWYYAREDQTPGLEQTLNAEQVMGEDTLVLAQEGDKLLEVAKEGLDDPQNYADSFATIRLSFSAYRPALSSAGGA